MIHMTRHLGIEALAEGVETAEHHLWLKDAGCSRAQGYFYSRPMPAADVTGWMDQQARSVPTGDSHAEPPDTPAVTRTALR